MPKPARLARAVLVLAALAAGCSRAAPIQSARRIGVPPDVQRLMEQGPDAGMGRLQFVALRPYDRARDLEVLLFSSGSPVFAGIVLPGRWVPLVSPWAAPFPARGFGNVRPDVLESLTTDKELWALPVTLDGALLVYRRDLWEELTLPPPGSLAALREAALHVRARRPEISKCVASDVPVDQLFWDLAWSYEGRASSDLYSYPKLHALGFIKEFGLAQVAGAETPGEQLVLQGRCAALFTSAPEARRLLAPGAPYAKRLRAVRLPSMQAAGHCIYAGWCLARPVGSDLGAKGWTGFSSGPYQRYLGAHQCEPVTRDEEPGSDEVSLAFSRTVFHAPPDLGPGGDEIVLGAILDAAQGPVDAEEALRRAEARIKRRSP